jgi:hypothetical protein
MDGKHTLVILACGALRVDFQQGLDGRQRGLEDESSMKGEKTPPQLAIGLSTCYPSSSIMRTSVNDSLGTSPVLALDSQVELSRVGIVITFETSTAGRHSPGAGSDRCFTKFYTDASWRDGTLHCVNLLLADIKHGGISSGSIGSYARFS